MQRFDKSLGLISTVSALLEDLIVVLRYISLHVIKILRKSHKKKSRLQKRRNLQQ